MTRHAPFSNKHIMEEYEAYYHDSLIKGDLMPLTYLRWLERRYARYSDALEYIRNQYHTNTTFDSPDEMFGFNRGLAVQAKIADEALKEK